MADPTKPMFKKPDFNRAGAFGKSDDTAPQVRVNFFMDEDLHTALKVHAAKNKMKIKEIMNMLVSDYLNMEKK